MKIRICLAASPSWVGLQDTITQKQTTGREDYVNAAQLFKALDSKEYILKSHHKVKQKNTDIV